MVETYFWSQENGTLHGQRGRLDPWRLAWAAGPVPAGADPVTPREALKRLAASHALRRVPVGIIGPKEATAAQLATAEVLGGLIAGHGLQLLCGGKNGVMEAACKGCLEAGGLPVGLIPDEEWHFANPYVAIPLATGIGPARNALIARACQVLIAVGGGYGTLSEMAYGLHFNRPVLALCDAPPVDGAIVCADAEEVMDRVCALVLERAGDDAGLS